ncbi:hypothetical protein [Flavobacterium sp. J27]|uniref:hypothetical protein n=1 Tax=Flavobacterium sp. J27 TaxID=2060419 RepID=UPI001031F748|nr:hypothetical protein [Flavobacterium sp. J27]
MKLIKKILLSIFFLFVITLVVGYFYFDNKFTPDANYLSVKNESGKIPIEWTSKDKKALLLPIHFQNDTTTYFLQFDTGSPYTLFYKNAILNISAITREEKIASSTFKIGQCEVSSNTFKMINFREQDKNSKLIGTLGADILEDRKTLIDFKNNSLYLNVKEAPKKNEDQLFDFKFKKRKIIIPAILDNQNENFLYDTGTSGYELLTTRENWEKLKLPNSIVTTEKGKSWDNVLTTYSARANQRIIFRQHSLALTEVTYVHGFSKTQYYLMKFSGMSGMLGNKIFLEHSIFIDCQELKIGIE